METETATSGLSGSPTRMSPLWVENVYTPPLFVSPSNSTPPLIVLASIDLESERTSTTLPFTDSAVMSPTTSLSSTPSFTELTCTRPRAPVTLTVPSTELREMKFVPPLTSTSPCTVCAFTSPRMPSITMSVCTPCTWTGIHCGMAISKSAEPGPMCPCDVTCTSDGEDSMSTRVRRECVAVKCTASRPQDLTVTSPAKLSTRRRWPVRTAKTVSTATLPKERGVCGSRASLGEAGVWVIRVIANRP